MLHFPPLTDPIDSGKFWVLRYSVCLRFAKSGIRTNSPKFPKSDNLTGQFPAHGGNIPGGAAVSFMYCNCNEPLFPLSPSLSRRVHWSREEGGDGGLSMLGVRTPLPAWCPTPLAGRAGHVVTISPVSEKILNGGVKINVYQLSLNHFPTLHMSQSKHCKLKIQPV